MDLAIIDATCASTSDQVEGLARSRYTISIANAPLVCHVLDELAQSGITRATAIVDSGVRDDVDQALGGASPGPRVTCVTAPDRDRRRAVLAEVRRGLDDGPVLLHPGDSLFRGQIIAMRDRYLAGDVDVVLPEQASGAGRHDSGGGRASDTVVLLGPGSRPPLDELVGPAGDGEDLIAALLHSDCRLAVCELTEQWAYDASTEALLAANRMLLDQLPDAPADHDLAEGNDVHGRIDVGRGTFISNCVIHGPVAIADRAVLEDSFIGPYTAIGPGAVLSGAEIENAMVMAGAEIRQPGHRLEASIIGERARVSRSFELPRGVHLRLGADSRVTFS